MPLHDHFHPPLSKRRHWRSFHGTWATGIEGQLNKRPLPTGFVAEAHVTAGVTLEADLGTFQEDDAEDPTGAAHTTAVWAPPKATITSAVDLTRLDVFEVRVYDEDMARTLVAAVELVSLANKDRLSSRRDFVAKCAAYLQQDVSVIIVDVVTARRRNLYAQLAEFLELNRAARGALPGDIGAVALRAIPRRKKMRLEVWPAPLALGRQLPTLPLWLTPDLAVPLDLEARYNFACDFLAIPA